MSVVRFGGVVQTAFTTGPSTLPATSSARSQSASLTLQKGWHAVAATSHQAASVLPALLSPVALIAFVLGAWRLGCDLGWTGDFLVADGFFSHWMVWIALATALQMAATG